MKTTGTRDCVAVNDDAAPGPKLAYVSDRREVRFRSIDVEALSVGTGRPRRGASQIGIFEFNELSDGVLLGWLTSGGRRPNVLIECAPGREETAMRHVMTWCALPFRYCALPGALELPDPTRGTLLLKDIAALTLSQQVRLYDWLTLVNGQVQVISLTSAPLVTLVENGEFLEGLLYRLNVIRIDGAAGTRPAPLDAWQISATTLA